ncbi:MAG: adenylate/guanylate cyclase domain-containing protein [Actinobacteria bacterium]|nr:adenylate/guanylate cyclase domain-containing protein [Actinomycetota bacterium]
MTDHERTPRGDSPMGDFTGRRPSGHVAFLFTDMQGSVLAWEREPDAMNDVIARHDDTVRAAIGEHGGCVFSVAGDAFGAAFHTVEHAVHCVLDAQRGLAAQEWPSGLAPRVRMGVHVGRAFERDGNYFGPTVNRAARIMSAGHGGQVLMSDEALAALTAVPDGVATDPLGQYRLRDLAEPVVIHQLSIEDLPNAFPPLRALDQSPRILRPSDAFVGRADEVQQLRWFLDTHSVVTVVASGGTGKTRLAYETAATMSSMFADGVFAVELADGGDDDVQLRIAEALLGDDPIARMEGATDVLAALQRHLTARRTLLVLDNCEHVLEAASAVVVALTSHCPQLTVLATSRERLGVPGEQVMPLAPLSTDRTDAGVSQAAELFLDRALGAHPNMDLSADTIDAIELVCAAVDGSALAIELAASRVRTLTPQQIAARLGEGLGLFRQRRGKGPDRHRSLESAIAWSHDLLGRDERRLLAWTSVFIGGFDLSAAEAIGRNAEIDDVVDVVESLVDKSLIAALRVGDSMRYRLAEPIRQFAHARLVESGHLERALLAHFEYCEFRARASVQLLDGPTDPPLFERLTAERDNFLAAVHRATERGDAAAAMALTASLDLWWAETGHLALAMRTMDDLVRSRPDNTNTPLVYVPLLWVATMSGELPRAREVRSELEFLMSERRLTPGVMGGAAFGFGFIDSALGDAASAAATWGAAGKAAAPFSPAVARQAFWSAGQSATAAGNLEHALQLFEAAEHLPGPTPGWFPGFIDVQRLVAASYTGKCQVERLDAGVAALENTGLRMRFLLAAAFASLGLFESGAPDRAKHWWQRSMHTGREIGNLWACWVMLECAAWSAMSDGDDTLAARFWQTRDTFAAQRGYGLWPVLATEGSRRRAVVLGRSPHVFDHLEGVSPWTLTEAVEVAVGPTMERVTS